MKAVVNGKIILKDRIVEGSALLFSDVIEGILPVDKIPSDAEIIDANGGYVSPGLIDLHIHGYLGCDVCDGTRESIRTISEGMTVSVRGLGKIRLKEVGNRSRKDRIFVKIEKFV